MTRVFVLAMAFLIGAPLSAQIFPIPGTETPRIQTVQFSPGEPIVLTALPQTALTVMLEPGEAIARATLGGSRAWKVSVSAEADSLQIVPQSAATPASLVVETDRRSYEFLLEVGQGLMAAYVVRLKYDAAIPAGGDAAETLSNLNWSYRLRGDREVRPLSVRDNGTKTVIDYGPDQALPAVFAIGPTGDEEVVNGYMRGDRFVIDRVHEELIFRIDDEKASAQRQRRDGEER